MNVAGLADWYAETLARIDRDLSWTAGDIIASWQARFAPVAARTITEDVAVLPDDLGGLFTFRYFRRERVTWTGPAPDDEVPDMVLGPTRAGFVARIDGQDVHDRDAARRLAPSGAGPVTDMLALLPASRRPATRGRGTDRVALARALAWHRLRLAGATKAAAARTVIDWDGGIPGVYDGKPDSGHLRTMYQKVEHTLRAVGIS